MNRLEILAKIDHLTDQHCKPCADKPGANEMLTKCKGCPIYDEFTACGDQLDELTRIKREAKKMECTKENYEMLKADGTRVGEIAHRLGVSTATLYNRKKEWYQEDIEVNRENYEKLLNDGLKQEDIAVKFGVSVDTLYRYRRDWYPKNDDQPEVNSDVKSKYIDQISNLNKQISSQREEHQKLMNDYEELSQQYAAAVKDKDEAVKQLSELQASKIDVDAMRALLKSLL